MKNNQNKNQIGCGYCDKEKICTIRDGKINKAKLGCKDFNHFENKKVLIN